MGKWLTRRRVHFDSVASAWAIKRFIDPDAEFIFEAPGEDAKRPKDAIPFALPGVKLGRDDKEVAFEKVLREYKLVGDPALVEMAKIIHVGIDYVVNKYRPPADDRYGQIAVGLLAVADGMVLLKPSDQDRLEASYVAYDALYALFKANKQR